MTDNHAVATGTPGTTAFGALHAADGLLILAISAYLYLRARQPRT
jgi:hypothetical protein